MQFFQSILLPLSIFAFHISPIAIQSLQLTTTSTLRGVAKQDLHQFLATPSNWPNIVASSHSVRPVPPQNRQIDTPLNVGDQVDEIFGLPPFVPLSVRWTCVKSDLLAGSLEFYSPDGLKNVANNCRMKFSIYEKGNKDSMKEGFTYEMNELTTSRNVNCVVELCMEFEPQSPLAILASPVLSLDNALALKVLLPNSVTRGGT